MNAHGPIVQFDSTGADALFPALSRAMFAASYPEGTHKLRHNLGAHPLLELEALARLGEALPAASVECHGGDLPIGETIRSIREAGGRAVLKNIEQVPACAALLGELLAELEPEIAAKTGKILDTQSSVCVSGPGAVTPFHADREHGILLQLDGNQAITVFPAGNLLSWPDPTPESDDKGDGRDLVWRDEFAEHGVTFRLEPGEAIYVPGMAPHHFRTGSEPSISLWIRWGSDWGLAEADARALNRLLRSWGYDPRPPGRWPARNRAKSFAWRVLRRLPGID
jgi:hypothetical protein